ncbi:MAG: two-component system response regulator [Betaproteobacteria bacterium]|nr:two-component system response regulator [Betaproteobacteria bacterium]
MEAFEDVQILLAEDNALDAELAMSALHEARLARQITWVKDGEEALDYLYCRGRYAQRSDVPPRLVFLDLKMPKVDGIEVLKIVKSDERLKHIPVVMMTSSQEESDIAETYKLGANSYIVKPLDMDTLADITRKAGYYWLSINRGRGQ